MNTVIAAYLEAKKGKDMSRLKELEKWADHKELIFPCDCANGDYLRITWDEQHGDFRYLWIEAWGNRIGPWKRIKGAWSILRNKSWQHTEIILTEETVVALNDFLSQVRPTK